MDDDLKIEIASSESTTEHQKKKQQQQQQHPDEEEEQVAQNYHNEKIKHVRNDYNDNDDTFRSFQETDKKERDNSGCWPKTKRAIVITFKFVYNGNEKCFFPPSLTFFFFSRCCCCLLSYIQMAEG